ncbi:MAG: glycerophosphodiester phosphodiesterase family protein [Desulfocapsaceae bacterium]|nr:glycerophosphodiester phosphodiesterase family protein [Desulfocapsaceae bacterium]
MKRNAFINVIAAAAVIVAATTGQGWAKMIFARNSDHFLPASSLPALAITISQGAENVYLSLAMSADNQVILLEDTVIDELTNAAEVFPEKAREDGSYHILDFTRDELQQLSLLSSVPTALSPAPRIGITTLEEALSLIRVMQDNLGRKIGIIGEIKNSWHYLHENRDISRAVIDICRRHGYTDGDSGFIIASYDPEELQRIQEELFDQAEIDLKILQLTEPNSGTQTRRFERGRWLPYNYDWLYTKFGLKAASTYTDIISLSPDFLVSETGDLLNQQYIEDAHILGMSVVVSSIDQYAGSLPSFSTSFKSLVDLYLFTAGADGLITEQDQLIRGFLESPSPENSSEEHDKTTIELLLENLKKQQQPNN